MVGLALEVELLDLLLHVRERRVEAVGHLLELLRRFLEEEIPADPNLCQALFGVILELLAGLCDALHPDALITSKISQIMGANLELFIKSAELLIDALHESHELST